VSDDGIDELLRAAQRVADGEPLTGDLLTEEKVPARLRILLAATALTAADRPVSKRAIVDAAPAAWSATYRNHADLLDAVKHLVPALVTEQLALAGTAPTSAQLRTQLDEAHASVRAERQRRQELERQMTALREYALELHRRLKPDFDQMMRERTQKVTQLRPVPDLPDDGGAEQ
jgi:chromosome condensin MukBEF ATPase and DNA-binding subunit MukB